MPELPRSKVVLARKERAVLKSFPPGEMSAETNVNEGGIYCLHPRRKEVSLQWAKH